MGSVRLDAGLLPRGAGIGAGVQEANTARGEVKQEKRLHKCSHEFMRYTYSSLTP